MSGETLREAAMLMRERAETTMPDGWGIAAVAGTWHPAVALAVADWLELEADSQDSYSVDVARLNAALAVARTYLGEN